MCGFYFSNYQLDEAHIVRVKSKIEHRGPDYIGWTSRPGFTMVHSRLAIQDLDVRSNQPMIRQSVFCVFNGEIYNFRELREIHCGDWDFKTTSDTEVLIALFCILGRSFVSLLEGMFAFVILDTDSGEVFAARDRLGQKPMYISVHSDRIQISSVLDAITFDDLSLNREAIETFLAAGHIPAPLTVFEAVNKVEAGTSLCFNLFDRKKLVQEKYWRCDIEARHKSTRELIEYSIDQRCHADVASGTFLSGGVDSTVIAGLSRKYGIKDAITIGYDRSGVDESTYAKDYAHQLGLNHKIKFLGDTPINELFESFIKAYDEPFADTSALSTLLLCQSASQEFKMCLSGDGADELFLGYNHQKFAGLASLLFILPYTLRKFFSKLLSDSPIKDVVLLKNSNHFVVGVFSSFKEIDENVRERLIEMYQFCFEGKRTIRRRLALFNTAFWIESDGNVKVDRASMFNGIEIRSPFMSHLLFEHSNTLADRRKRRFGQSKIPLRKIFNELIPENLRMKRKMGFDIPIEPLIQRFNTEELKSDVRKLVYPLISDRRVEEIETVIKGHSSESHDVKTQWRLIVLASWLKQNI